ncbi:redoxin domain-containing protein [Methylacidimicrobium tartarophylax]|uniref:Peroxiredoxin n=1 Tax=Methylacidimicrobium tartarophylax TaxID=1041768 RepID=A0A5E6M6Z0_9BACT|nr:redoxin domain-containing protein [Methylacidimicrobium tartarophylax]VVM04711.1 Putative peroxiredoxin [Methylacidimicrobium tartarophylax]
MALSVGATAPDFTLKQKTPEGLIDVRLSSFRGKKVVLLFFPLAFTSVCTEEMCRMTGGLNAYERLEASILGVSVDNPFAQEAWAQREGIRIPLLSDLNKEVSRAYGVLLSQVLGIGDVAARAVFVIDRAGKIAYREVTANPTVLPQFSAIEEAVGRLD